MLKRNLIVIYAAFYLVVFAAIAHAQLPQISTGLSYLASSQNTDGTWGTNTSLAETTASTVSVLETLKLLNQTAGSSYAAGTSWLQGQSPLPVDYIAERIRVLVLTDVSLLIPAADSTRGGWGGDTGYETNNLDTALAIQALKAANYPDLSVSNTALAYLTNTQNANGGWGFYQGDDSNIYMTAIVSATLQQFPQSTAIAAAVTKASVYLTKWQNADGGFGISPAGDQLSTAYETALAYMALVGDGQTADLPLQNALNFLAASQSANGSWNDDPYSTALALRALYLSEHKPPPLTPAATTGSVMGTVVAATTSAPLSGVSVTLAGDPSFTATTNAGGSFSLINIPSGAQQITLTYPGYAPLTVTASISAGTFINVGRITLSANPTTGVIQGVVWDAEVNAPYPGVTVQAITESGGVYETVSAADGSYRIGNVPPGIVGLGTPFGPKPGYFNIRFTGTLAPGGIILFNPVMSKTPPLTVDMTVQTDKKIYQGGQSVGLAFTLTNTRYTAYVGLLKVRVTGPNGASVYETSADVTMTEYGTTTHSLGFPLPASAPSGFYTVVAEIFDGWGKRGTASTTFNLYLSEIEVTPVLPDSLAAGANTVSFRLANTGTLAVSAGALAVTMKDPDGQVIATGSQPFTLGRGESKTLTYPVSLPDIRFGAYTITYTQSDETTGGQAKDVTLPNTIGIAPVFDKTTYRIRETLNLNVGLTNGGRFSLNNLTVNVAAPDTGYSETRTINIGPGQTLNLLHVLALPETMVAGPHAVTITATLPTGSAIVQNAQFVISGSSLTDSISQSNYQAGEIIHPVITNNGGVDTQVQSRLSLYDAKSWLVAEQTGTDSVAAGSSRALSFAIPDGAADGTYNLVVDYKDLKTGKEDIVPHPITIAGVKGTLQVRTDKETYLLTENIAGLSTITNSGAASIPNGNLHLQVVTEAGSQVQKTWTSQLDFQQGVRDGVDTYGVNDWLIPDDDFDFGLDLTKWGVWGTVLAQSGKVLVDSTASVSGMGSIWSLTGDFDVQVDFSNNNSCGAEGAEMTANGGAFGLYVKNTAQNGREAGAFINGSWTGWRAIGGYQQSGKLRIARAGATITAYNWDGTGWTSLLSVSGSAYTANASISLDVWRGQNCAANCKFDNFKVNSGRIATKSESVDSVRLLRTNDNFDDSVLNVDRWTVRSSGSATANESNGALVTKDTLTGVQSYADVAGRFPLEGDYDVSIDWKTPVAPASGEWGAVFQVSDVDQTTAPDNNLVGNALQIKRAYVDGLGHIYQTGHYNGSTWDSWSSPVATTDTTGRFRIKRAGSSATVWYWNSSLNRWEWNGDTAGYTWSSVWTTPAYVRIGVPNNAPNNPSVETDWNNFKVGSGAPYLGNGTIRMKQDAGRISSWRTLTWSSTQPLGTSITLRTRTAANEAGLSSATWSDYLTVSGSPVTSPPARWIEIEATLSTSNTSVTPLLHDVTVTYGNNPGDVVWQTDVPVNLAQGAAAELTNAIGTLGAAGKYYLQGTLTSSTGQAVAVSEYPFFVEQGNTDLLFSTDKRIYRPGETVTVQGEVKNLSSVNAAGLVLQVQGTGGGTGTLYSETFSVPANSSHPFSFTTTAGSDGTYGLNGVVTQNSITLVMIADQYVTASPAITAAITAPDSAGNDSFTITLSLSNTGKVAATTTMKITDDGGNVLDSQEVAINAGETRILPYTRQITGATTYTATFTGDLNQTISKAVAFAASPPAGIALSVSSDRVSYNANEQVAITATITNQGTAAMIESLSAWITVTSSQGQALFSDTAPLQTLIQGQTIVIKKYWNTGTNPAGTYLVSIQILDAAGSVISRSTCNLTISSAAKPTALLKGKISLDRQSILTGEPITVSYSVTNAGNNDVSNIAFSVQTVSVNEQTVYNSIADQATLAMGANYTNNGRINTQNYGARDYLVLLRAAIAGVEETLAGTYFRVEGAPSAPALNGPANGADVETFTPRLSVSNAADPNDDKLTYEFEVYVDSGLTSLVTTGMVSETAAITAWTVPAPLTENQTYFWRARAYDGKLYGPWTAPAAFRVNTVNDPPSAPTISSPADGTAVALLTPTLTISNSTDPDSSSLTYNFDVARDPDFAQIVASAKGVASGAGSTTWTVPASLQENSWYYWRAQADDWLVEGPWSATMRFFVNTTNDPPSAPVVTTPGNGSSVPALEADIIVTNAKDPDSSSLTYNFEVDTVPTFDSANILRSGTVAEGEGSTAWHVTGLTDNTRYYVRVKASDGTAESPWSAVTNFFANTVNDPPTTPILANPSNGAGVNVLTPTLSVHNSSDPDHDIPTYEFELYADAALTNRVAHADGVAEIAQVTVWEVPVPLLENQTYYWRARAYDGSLHSDWMPTASFMVNTANDAPSAPGISSPANGSSLATLTPTFAVVNAVDPDSETLTYQFEIYAGDALVAAARNVPGDRSGVTSWTLGTALDDNTVYQWRVRAFDGDCYGSWTAMATFTVHIPITTITATIDFDPNTLNRSSNGTWVVVYMEFPAGYKPADVDVSSIRLEGAVPAEIKPYAIGDHDRNGVPDLMVKFRRQDVINLLKSGDSVPVHVTGTVGSTPFEGVDVIRVIQ